mmetsp:Transcript_7228/g.10343  ORF Transcript_7228/g.10343 Transcript_7228/m.10343 type:complete len:256 (-) Transcript_7228:547-1314(-)
MNKQWKGNVHCLFFLSFFLSLSLSRGRFGSCSVGWLVQKCDVMWQQQQRIARSLSSTTQHNTTHTLCFAELPLDGRRNCTALWNEWERRAVTDTTQILASLHPKVALHPPAGSPGITHNIKRFVITVHTEPNRHNSMVHIGGQIPALGLIRRGVETIIDAVGVEPKIGAHLIGDADRSHGCNRVDEIIFVEAGNVEDLGDLSPHELFGVLASGIFCVVRIGRFEVESSVVLDVFKGLAGQAAVTTKVVEISRAVQ